MPVYLNHAGTTWPKPAAVVQACSHAMERSIEGWDDGFELAHRRVAEYLGIQDPASLLLTPGCTSSLAVAVADIDWQPGDVIVTSSLEHHALHRPLLKVVESAQQWKNGIDLVVIPPAVDGPFDLQRFSDVLACRQVKLVAVTAASNVTGELLPYEEIAALARRHNTLCLVDGAQIVGWQDLRLSDSAIDLFAFGGHKGLHGPWGIGGLYIAPGVVMQTPQATCDLGERNANCGRPSYCDVGSVDRIALAGLSAAMDWLDERTDRLTKARRQIERITQVLESIPGTIFFGGALERRMPTVAFRHRKFHVREVDAILRERGIVGSAGLQCAPMAHEILGSSPDGVMRLSVGPMNNEAEIDAATEALQALRA